MGAVRSHNRKGPMILSITHIQILKLAPMHCWPMDSIFRSLAQPTISSGLSTNCLMTRAGAGRGWVKPVEVYMDGMEFRSELYHANTEGRSACHASVFACSYVAMIDPPWGHQGRDHLCGRDQPSGVLSNNLLNPYASYVFKAPVIGIASNLGHTHSPKQT